MARDVSEYAKYDPAFACDGLFVPRAAKGQALYDVKREWDQGEIGFRGVQLTAAHQSLLLAICARTGRDGLKVCGGVDSTERRTLSVLLDEVDDVIENELSRVNVTAYALLVDAGLGHGGRDYQYALELLKSLAAVSVYRRVGRVGGSSRLLTFRHRDDHLEISLNWRLAAAIFGHQNVRVSLFERHKLESSVAKLLHCWMSCHIREGKSLMAGKGARLDTLLRHVWGKRPASSGVHRNRRMLLRRALLNEIGELRGWAVGEDEARPGVWLISRPKLVKGDEYYLGTPSEREAFYRSMMENRRH